MFYIRYTNGSGETVVKQLMPSPTEVEYPETRLLKVHTTQDGATVVQRPLRDSRPRKWVWKGYRDSDLLAAYANQWQELAALEYRTRLEAGLNPLVEIWEDETSVGGFDRMDGEDKVYTTVKFIRVDRAMRKGGGPVTYEDSYIEFYVEDDTYRGF